MKKHHKNEVRTGILIFCTDSAGVLEQEEWKGVLATKFCKRKSFFYITELVSGEVESLSS